MKTPPASTRAAHALRVAFLVLFAFAAPLQAQIKARLSSTTCPVGGEVSLFYDFSSKLSADPEMPSIEVDGLRIMREKRSVSGRVVNNAHRFTYVVSPERPGTFRIPPLELRVGGKTLRAPALELKATPDPGAPRSGLPPGQEPPPFYPFNRPSATPPAPRPSPAGTVSPVPAPSAPPRVKAPAPPPPASEGRRAAFARMEIRAERAYVGEVVPVTLRYYLRTDLVFDGPLTQPYIAGDGFAALPLREVAPQAKPETVDGTAYNVISFRTAIIPARTGTINIPDAVLKGRQLVNHGWVQQPAGLPAPGGGELRDFEVAAPGRTLEAHEIPAAGRPAGFTGGIGEFSVAARAAEPSRSRAGEPVKWRLSVTGRGNFSALRAPLPDRTPGWRVYDPGEIFTEGAEVDGGTKTFEFTLVARRDETATPGAGMSYFNPRTGTYESLRFDPVPVESTGPDEGAGFLAVEQPVQPTPAVSSSPLWHSTFLPALKSPWFRILQAVLSALLVLWLLAHALRKYREHRANDISIRLEAELRGAIEALREAGTEPGAFYNAAARVILARLAALQGKPAAPDEAGRLLVRLVGNMVRREELLAILSRSDELKYGTHEVRGLAPGERENATKLLEDFCASRN